MRNLNIGTRLALGFGFVIVLILVMAGSGSWGLLTTQHNTRELTTQQHALDLVHQWSGQVDVMASQTLAAAKVTDPIAQASFKGDIERTYNRILMYRQELQSMLTQDEAKALYDEATDTDKDYTEAREQAFEQQEEGNEDAANRFFNADLPRLTSQYTEQMDELSDIQSDYLDSLSASNEASINLGLIIFAALTGLAIILAPLFSWRVARSITQPMRRAVTLAESVAKRDLSHDIVAHGKDEVAELEQALRQMVSGLNEAVSQVREGADSIADASSQITAGNTDLSSRTEQQSSSLAETAATMEQITSTVRQNADNARQANSLAESASQTATNGGDNVSSLIHTMGDIHARSTEVADIVGVIDGIAFQTNILALNAAVEAARAGEQGRGFAVVASEVRALAQRSATSAREIRTLIDTSVEAITRGNQQAESAGTTMQEIVDSIQRVTDIMGEISAASDEQTTGVEQINVAVTQMDDVTRQNASLVEESAAAAASLQAQATALASLVATFQVSSQTGGLDQPSSNEATERQPTTESPENGSAASTATLPVGGAMPALALAGGGTLAAGKADDDWSEF